MSKHTKLHTFKMSGLLYVNYTLIKLLRGVGVGGSDTEIEKK